MQDQLMRQGFELMLYGIGTVFTFLVLLIVATTLMSYLLRRFSTPEPVVAAPTNQDSVGDKRLVAAITGAIQKYRTRNKK